MGRPKEGRLMHSRSVAHGDTASAAKVDVNSPCPHLRYPSLHITEIVAAGALRGQYRFGMPTLEPKGTHVGIVGATIAQFAHVGPASCATWKCPPLRDANEDGLEFGTLSVIKICFGTVKRKIKPKWYKIQYNVIR